VYHTNLPKLALAFNSKNHESGASVPADIQIFLFGSQNSLSAGQLVPAMPGTVGQYTISFLHQPRFKLFQSLKLLINLRVTDRALEKFNEILAQVFPQTFI